MKEELAMKASSPIVITPPNDRPGMWCIKQGIATRSLILVWMETPTDPTQEISEYVQNLFGEWTKKKQNGGL